MSKSISDNVMWVLMLRTLMRLRKWTQLTKNPILWVSIDLKLRETMRKGGMEEGEQERYV